MQRDIPCLTGTYSSITLNEGLELAKACVVDQVLPEYDTSLSGSTNNFPSHLSDLLERSSTELNESEKAELRNLLQEYQDVFAKDDYDLGNFTALEHSIDIGNSPPIKYRIRRTPSKFEGEEEIQLKKMLDSGVIKPSNSEWASVPVLIRKKSGAVR